MEDRRRVLQLIERYGWNSTAFQTLESGYAYAFFGEDACVAYVDTGAAWVVAGAPIAAPERLRDVTEAFLLEARRSGRRCCFFAVEDRLQAAVGAALRSFAIGEQPVWDPREWARIIAGHRSLREQLRRARAKGVRTRELSALELQEGKAHDGVARVAERWLSTRNMAPMHFLVRVEPFAFPTHRRCFVAEVRGEVVGFAGVVPVPARAGWFLEDLVRDPKAPNGTAELLVDAVMRSALGDGKAWLTLGFAPLSGHVAAPLRAARKSSKLLYDFDGLRRYKAKLRPNSWSQIYLAYPRTQGAVRSLFDSLVAFTPRGLLHFGLHTLVRGPAFMIRLLTALLVPWVVVLGLAPSEHWFGTPWLKWAWVAFDVLVAGALFRLLRRPTATLTLALALAVTGDALLTLLQAAVWNLPRAENAFEYSVIALTCSAPLLAALVLWGSRRTRLRSS